MAQPISLQIPPRDPRQELRKRLEDAPQEHAEALLDSLQLIQQLHEQGVFELLRGALGVGNTLVGSVVDGAKTDASVRAIRNTIILVKMLSSINPDLLQGYALAVGETLGSSETPVIEPPGLFSLLSQFRHKELRRSIALINRFLEAFGNQLSVRGGPGRSG